MKKWLSVVLVGCLLVVAGCGSQTASTEGTTQESSGGSSAQAVTTDDAGSTSQTSTDTTDETDVAEADTSEDGDGSNILYVYSAGPKGLSSGLQEAFQEETGIQVELYQGTTGNILSKLEAEKSNPIADVVVLASWPSALGLKSEGMLMSYPEAENADKLYDDFIDDDYELFGYSASALGITYNTTLVSADEVGTDWSDYTEDAWKDQVTIPDPSQSGSCMDFISGYVSTFGDDGWQMFKDLKANGVEMSGANKEALEPVLTGSKSAVLAGVDYMAYSNKAKGEPVDIIYPESGTVVNPRAAMIMKDAANVENAKKFIDFLLSDEGQELVKEAYIIPGRSDITCDNRANLSDIPLLDYDWDVMVEKETEDIETITSIFQ